MANKTLANADIVKVGNTECAGFTRLRFDKSVNLHPLAVALLIALGTL